LWQECGSGGGGGGGNEKIAIYFSQTYVHSLNDIMYNEYHDYPLVATAACFVYDVQIDKAIYPHQMYMLGQLNLVVW